MTMLSLNDHAAIVTGTDKYIVFAFAAASACTYVCVVIAVVPATPLLLMPALPACIDVAACTLTAGNVALPLPLALLHRRRSCRHCLPSNYRHCLPSSYEQHFFYLLILNISNT